MAREKLEIVQIISNLNRGGAERLVVDLSNELVKQNHSLSILTFKKNKEGFTIEDDLDKRVDRITLRKKSKLDLRLLLDILKHVRAIKPDIVHIHLSMPLNYMLPFILFYSECIFFYTIHNTIKPHLKSFKFLSKFSFFKKVHNICLSTSIKENFESHFPKLKYSVVENGINEIQKPDDKTDNYNKFLELKKSLPHQKIFLFIGRLAHQKNIPVLLDVFQNPELQTCLLIIGDGDDQIKRKVELASKDAESKIVYLGPLNNVSYYLSLADGLILTSRYEGLPIVILEALSMGVPVISTPVGGIPDVIKDGKNGFLSKSTEKKDITDAVRRFLELNDNDINSICKNNKTLFKDEFSISACAEKHLNLYYSEYKRK